MAFDGFTTAGLRYELDQELAGGFISKVIQPESDELLLTIKTASGTKRLVISANPSLPVIHLTDTNRQAPVTAPAFCMLLRKHLSGGRILSVMQPSLERILIFSIEHRNELGDLCQKQLITEFMGKHSNIILTDEENTILDSIRRIPSHISSVREVLPGRPWFIPNTQDKLDPLSVTEEVFDTAVFHKPCDLGKAIYTSLTGFSPSMAEELCARAAVDPGSSAGNCTQETRQHLYHTFIRMIDEVRNAEFDPAIFYSGNTPQDFSVLSSTLFPGYTVRHFESISDLIFSYYSEKEQSSRIRQKSADLRKIITSALERNAKKLILQQKQLEDTKKMDKYRIYGELLNTYGYSAVPGDKELIALNYYTNENIRIPLDPTLSASDNAKKYFERYNKLKRTAVACEQQKEETIAEIAYLESVQAALDTAADAADLSEIRRELSEAGYMKKISPSKKDKIRRKAAPLHFLSTDGFDIYVGKNNYQNEEITFSIASGSDWWFHAKNIPGSHVVLKCDGKKPTDLAFEEAASLAAFYSKGKNSEKVEIDYTLRKNIRKPAGARPGFVIYYTNYSMMVRPCADPARMIV